MPDTTKISKEAKECVQECVSEFIAFVTAEAADRCGVEKRKTVGGEDILHALTTLGFDNYSEALKIYLARLRQVLLILFLHFPSCNLLCCKPASTAEYGGSFTDGPP